MTWGLSKWWQNCDFCFSPSGVWTFLWFVCFCVLANQWSHTTQTGVLADAARAVVTFSFFSTATWVSTSHFLFLPDGLLVYLINWNKYHAFFFSLKAILTTFAFQRYRQGVDEVGLGYNDPSSSDHTSPYPSAYAGAPEGYQQSPFTASAAAQGGYQPPAYWAWRHFNAFHKLHFFLFHNSWNCDLGLVCYAGVFFFSMFEKEKKKLFIFIFFGCEF